MSRFAEMLPSQGTIGQLRSTIIGGNPVTQWVTLYECKADVQTLRGIERFEADAVKTVATHRIFLPTHDMNGDPMDLKESYEFVEVVPFDYDTQKDLTRYRFKLVDPVGGHHFEVEAERVSPSG